MENIKTISDLTFSLSLNDNQELEINNSGVSEKISIGQLKTFITSNKVDLDGSNADFGNLSNTAKDNLLKLIIPNTINPAEEHSLPWTVTDYGFISFSYNNNGNTNQLLINGNNASTENKFYNDFQCLVRKGDIISVAAGGTVKIKFWACGN